jgi:ABC-2 type transport system permease protein
MIAWQITSKDLTLLLRDRRTLFLLIALPMLFITILGFSAGQLFSEKAKSKKVRLGVVNHDDSDLSGMLLGEVESIEALELTEISDRQQGLEQLSDGKIEVLVVIGSRYHELIEELDFSDVVYLKEGRLSGKLQGLDIEVQAGAFLANAAEIVEELVFAFAVKTIMPGVLKQTDQNLARRLKKRVEELREARPMEPAAARPEPAAVKSRSDIIYQFLVPSYTVMFVFFIVNFMARSLIGERDMGTLHRLLVAPLTRGQLMIGKTIPFLLISLVQTWLLFLAGKVLFHMSWGEHPWMLLPVMLCTSLAATALGLLVATAVRTESQVTAYANFLVLTMAALSGCLMPRSWQPEIMQRVGLGTPHAWALIAYDQLLSREMTNVTAVWNCCGVLLTFAAGFLGVAWWRFKTLE